MYRRQASGWLSSYRLAVFLSLRAASTQQAYNKAGGVCTSGESRRRRASKNRPSDLQAGELIAMRNVQAGKPRRRRASRTLTNSGQTGKLMTTRNVQRGSHAKGVQAGRRRAAVKQVTYDYAECTTRKPRRRRASRTLTTSGQAGKLMPMRNIQ
ncbi:unnamed protein product [Lasius platythorax]|uniref:Secreted protein n=1 Tax=Lasius platythorax TaxID=488582 RepID=A0AAV2N010_9HYME